MILTSRSGSSVVPRVLSIAEMSFDTAQSDHLKTRGGECIKVGVNVNLNGIFRGLKKR